MKKPAGLLLLALALVAGPARGQDLADPEAWMKEHLAAWQRRLDTPRVERSDARVDLGWCDLRLWPDMVTGAIQGQVTLCLRSLQEGLGDVALDLHDNLAVSAVDGAASFTHSGNQLLCQLPAPLGLDQSVCLTVHYSGNPASTGFGSYELDTHAGVPILATLSEPDGAPSWWPTKDDPSDKADSARVAITVPLGYTATSNGVLQSADTLGAQVTFTWRELHPIATYLICMSVTNYVAIADSYTPLAGGSMPVVHYVWPEDLADAQVDLDVTVPMIGHFARTYGEYPFVDEKYGHSEFTWGGAMEHQCNTSYGSALIRGDHYYDYIVAHELAHQWFGDKITCAAWEDIWLNEGFATYSEALWKESLGGHAALVQHMTTRCAVTDPSGPIYNPPSTFNSNTVYRKGAWLLHMLRGQVGDSAFFPLMRQWAEGPFAYASAHVTDFTAHAQAFTPRDLTGLWAGYLYGLNRPNYRWDWRSRTVGGHPVCEIRVRQNQSEAPFDLWLPWRVTAGSASLAERRNTLRLQGHVVVTTQAPTAVVLDPDDWILESKGSSNLNGMLRHLALLGRHADASTPAPGALRARCGTQPGSGSWVASLEDGVLALELRELAPDWVDGDSLWLEVESLDPAHPGEGLLLGLAPSTADWQDLGVRTLQHREPPMLAIEQVAGSVRLWWNALSEATAYRVEAAVDPWQGPWTVLGQTQALEWTAPATPELRCFRVVALY